MKNRLSLTRSTPDSAPTSVSAGQPTPSPGPGGRLASGSTGDSKVNLCLQCGLCCDGTLFRDVELQPGDNSEGLTAAGIPLKSFRRQEQGRPTVGWRFHQPCVALGREGTCAVYSVRPHHCRGFDCALLQSYQAGDIQAPAALKTIRQTRRRADQIRRLLEELGQVERQLPLTRRFQKLQRQILRDGLPATLDPEIAAERFGDLMAAVGELQLTLRLAFYPDAP